MLAILVLLAVLAARADASPYDERDLDVDDVGPVTVPEPPAALAPAPVLVPVSIAELRRVAAVAPPIQAVVAAAYRTAGLDHDPAPSWRVRTRLAGLVPMVSVRDGEDASWRDITDPVLGHVHVFDVHATWRFDRLLFDPNEVRISALETSRHRERRRLATTTIHTYYEWLRARAAATTDGQWTVHAEETAAELDALTDGWFTEMLGKAPEPR